MRTYYEILNVSADSENVVIRAAYRALMAKYHPDKFRGDSSEADRMAKLINEAYEVLSDPQRRAAYDSEIGLSASTVSEEAEEESRPDRRNRESSSTAGSAKIASASTWFDRTWQAYALAVACIAVIAAIARLSSPGSPPVETKSPPSPQAVPADKPVGPLLLDQRARAAQYPSYRSTIPKAFRGAWDEIISDKCEAREPRFYFDDRNFYNFEVDWEVTKVKLYSPTEMDIYTTRYDEDKSQKDTVWEFKLVDDGKSLTSRKAGATFYKRCPTSI